MAPNSEVGVLSVRPQTLRGCWGPAVVRDVLGPGCCTPRVALPGWGDGDTPLCCCCCCCCSPLCCTAPAPSASRRQHPATSELLGAIPPPKKSSPASPGLPRRSPLPGHPAGTRCHLATGRDGDTTEMLDFWGLPRCPGHHPGCESPAAPPGASRCLLRSFLREQRDRHSPGAPRAFPGARGVSALFV